MGLQQQVGLDTPSPNIAQRVVHKVAGSGVGGAVLARIARPLDKAVAGVSGGRATSTELLTGLPILMLTTTGAQSDKDRTVPVLGIPFGDDFGLQSGNFGVTSTPAWVQNLRANPEATIEYNGKSVEVVARAASEAEAADILNQGTELFAGLADYGRRAQRTLDVFVLSPAES